MNLLKVTDKEWAHLISTTKLADKNFGIRESIYASENRDQIRLIGEIIKHIAKRNNKIIQ